MKIDRMLEIIIYLINHDNVTAKQLSDRYNVSVRTIQRDMDSISIAGVPIVSNMGSKGGYSILSSYKLENQFINKSDFNLLILALKSLQSGYDNERLDSILEKYLTLTNENESHIYLDYGVLREDARTLHMNKLLEKAILSSECITFNYQKENGEKSIRTVEPIAIKFKWYAWYLTAYDLKREDYRTFKVARIRNIKQIGNKFEKPENIESILLKMEDNYVTNLETIKIWCQKEYLILAQEYFPNIKSSCLPDGNYVLTFVVPPGERIWQSHMLSMGNKIKILEPSYYKNEIIKTAKDFLSNYDI